MKSRLPKHKTAFFVVEREATWMTYVRKGVNCVVLRFSQKYNELLWKSQCVSEESGQ